MALLRERLDKYRLKTSKELYRLPSDQVVHTAGM